MNRQPPTLLVEADSVSKRKFRTALLRWFDKHQRDLPWRKNRTLYRIWVSEIMLQQTQVATVIEYYKRFLKRFPSVRKLAAAEESEVLKLWEGLGYYRRARQLHAAAKVVVDQHKGRFPDSFEEVLALPGVGRYTAGAILSIGADQKHPILEGNTYRLYARLLKMEDDPRKSANQKTLWQFADSLLPKKRCGDFNQALMELGSEICVPKSPDCSRCPVVRYCPTFHGGLQSQIPVSAKKMKYESLHEGVVLLTKGIAGKKQRYLIRLCGEDERWTGLWDFPRFEIKDRFPNESLSEELKRLCGLGVVVEALNVQIRHAVTRYRIKLDVYRAERVGGRLKQSKTETFKWATSEELASLPMSSTGRKVASRCCS